MKEETINEVTMDPRKWVDIFCKRKYKGYHIRGTIFPLRDGFQDEYDEVYKVYVHYRFVITALVNEEYLRETTRRREKLPEAGYLWDFYVSSEKEYLKEVRDERLDDLDFWREEPEARRSNDDFYGETIEEYMKNRTLVIGLDEADIQESEYLDKAIRSKKEGILLNMDFVVNRIEIVSPEAEKRDHLARIYTIPALYCPDGNRNFSDDFDDFFGDQFETAYYNFDYNYLEKKEYEAILKSIGELGGEWIQKNSVSKRYLKKLNRLNSKMGDRTYPLTDFCWQFFDDLIDDLTTKKQIKKCQFCGDFFAYQSRWPNKKFCSPTFEGKSCRKSHDNRLDYQRHQEERKLKAKEYQVKTRAEKKEEERLKAEKKKEKNREYQRGLRAPKKKLGIKK